MRRICLVSVVVSLVLTACGSSEDSGNPAGAANNPDSNNPGPNNPDPSFDPGSNPTYDPGYSDVDPGLFCLDFSCDTGTDYYVDEEDNAGSAGGPTFVENVTGSNGTAYAAYAYGSQVWLDVDISTSTSRTSVLDGGTIVQRDPILATCAEAISMCPAGYHVPSEAEWNALTAFIADMVGNGSVGTYMFNSFSAQASYSYAEGGLNMLVSNMWASDCSALSVNYHYSSYQVYPSGVAEVGYVRCVKN